MAKRTFILVVLWLGLAAGACGPGTPGTATQGQSKLTVVGTVSPVTNIIYDQG